MGSSKYLLGGTESELCPRQRVQQQLRGPERLGGIQGGTVYGDTISSASPNVSCRSSKRLVSMRADLRKLIRDHVLPSETPLCPGRIVSDRRAFLISSSGRADSSVKRCCRQILSTIPSPFCPRAFKRHLHASITTGCWTYGIAARSIAGDTERQWSPICTPNCTPFVEKHGELD